MIKTPQDVLKAKDLFAKLKEDIASGEAQKMPEIVDPFDMDYHSMMRHINRTHAGIPERHKNPVVPEGEWKVKFDIAGNMMKEAGAFIAIVGDRGTGKTQMAVEIMRQFITEKRIAKFITAMEFFIRVRATFKKDAKESEQAIMKEFSSCDLLVIDEIGKRSESQWENNLLFELLNSRYNDMKATILIDNNSAADFTRAIGPSIASRMQECGGIIECNWKSFRA